MKKQLTLMVVVGCMALAGASSAWAGEFGCNQQQVRQVQRIHQGVHSGQLTRAEVHALNQERHYLRHAQRLARADGRLTHRERVSLSMQQDLFSRHIYEMKHNRWRQW